jgi:hypothetical protein
MKRGGDEGLMNVLNDVLLHNLKENMLSYEFLVIELSRTELALWLECSCFAPD